MRTFCPTGSQESVSLGRGLSSPGLSPPALISRMRPILGSYGDPIEVVRAGRGDQSRVGVRGRLPGVDVEGGALNVCGEHTGADAGSGGDVEPGPARDDGR